MDQLQLTDFLRYRFLAQPKFAPDGQRAAFTVTNCNEEENCYETRLWLWEAGRLRQLTDLGKESRFFWEDNTHLLFPAVRSKAEQKRQEAKEEFTSFYRLAARQPTPLPSPLPPGPFTTSPAPGIWRRAASTPPGRTITRWTRPDGKPWPRPTRKTRTMRCWTKFPSGSMARIL